jgi:hypothetical protein
MCVLEVLLEVRRSLEARRSYAKSEHSLQYDFAREEAFRWAFGLEQRLKQKLGFDPIQSDLIKVEPQNPVDLSFWRETCPVLNLAALIPKLDAEPAVHSPSSAH